MRPAATACIQPELSQQHRPRSSQHPGETPCTRSQSSGPGLADAGLGWAGRRGGGRPQTHSLESQDAAQQLARPGPACSSSSPLGPEPTVPEWGSLGRSTSLKQGGWGRARTPQQRAESCTEGSRAGPNGSAHAFQPLWVGLPQAQGGRGLTSPPPTLPGLTPPFWPKMLPGIWRPTDECHGASSRSVEGRSSREGSLGRSARRGIPPPLALACRGALGQAQGHRSTSLASLPSPPRRPGRAGRRLVCSPPVGPASPGPPAASCAHPQTPHAPLGLPTGEDSAWGPRACRGHRALCL